MVTEPVATPVTTPVEGLTVATAESLVIHVPPDTESVNVIVDPVQTADGPPMALTELTIALTVKASVALLLPHPPVTV